MGKTRPIPATNMPFRGSGKHVIAMHSSTQQGSLQVHKGFRCCSLQAGSSEMKTSHVTSSSSFSSLGEFRQYIPEVGQPYQWAQWLCGLQFLKLSETSTAVTTKANLSVSACHMDGAIKRVRQRVRARLSLQKQLAALGWLLLAQQTGIFANRGFWCKLNWVQQ